MTIFTTQLPGFAFCTNDPNNPVNGRSVLALASIGASGVAPFGTAPGSIPGVSLVATNVRADGLALGPSAPTVFAAPVPPAAIEVSAQNPTWLQAASGGQLNQNLQLGVPAPVTADGVLLANNGANIASTIS